MIADRHFFDAIERGLFAYAYIFSNTPETKAVQFGIAVEGIDFMHSYAIFSNSAATGRGSLPFHADQTIGNVFNIFKSQIRINRET